MLFKTDLYICERTYPIDERQRDILSYLYLPLIGQRAYSVYHFLYEESKRMTHFHHYCGLSRLTSYLNISLDQLENACKMLEGIGLLRTFRQSEEKTIYLYVVQHPLSLNKFLHNQVLVQALRHTLGEEQLNITIHCFKSSHENRNDYEDISSRFTDVYSVDLSNARALSFKDVDEESYEEFHVEYDLSLFYESLRDYGIPHKKIAAHEDLIKQLAIIYSLDALTLASVVRESYHNQEIDTRLLREKAKNVYKMNSFSTLKEIYRTQPDQFKMNSHSHSALDQHLLYLETISPYELLKRKQGGGKPVLHDLSIAETLMVELGLNPGVVNVLIELVMGINNNKLPRSYCETIGASWARRRIHTVKQAYEQAMRIRKGKQEEEEEKKEEITNEEVISDPLDNDDLVAMLQKVKGI